MSTHKYMDRICCIVLVLAIVLTVVLMNLNVVETEAAGQTMEYENRLFDTDSVHTIDIVMEDWDGFIETCENEEYSLCSVEIDGEEFRNVGIRAKGNTSLSSVSAMDSDRYSFKIEFDQYDSSENYYGLDKLSLNNLIQDNTCMKDYMVYQMMREFGVDAPLCSYAYITVNGEDWGLYLAVEGVEESFLQRNYGSDYGELYKPDSVEAGGGRGNGKDFKMDEITDEEADMPKQSGNAPAGDPQKPDGGMQKPNGEQPDGGMQKPNEEQLNGGMQKPNGEQPNAGKPDGDMQMPEIDKQDENMDKSRGMGSNDVKLQYIDDDSDSYSGIFDNAKTDVTNADKTRLIEALKALGDQTDIESTVDVEEVLRYFVVHNFVVDGDSYTGSMVHNYYLYEKDGQLSMIPWDYNLAFGTFQGNDATDAVNEPVDTPVMGGETEDRPMVAWIFSDEEYTQLYHEYFEDFLSTWFDNGKFDLMVTKTQALIAPYVQKDPTKFCTYEEFEKGVETLESFCNLRAESVKGQLEGTIPSTSEEQSADSSACIDASAITLSDMGTMGRK